MRFDRRNFNQVCSLTAASALIPGTLAAANPFSKKPLPFKQMLASSMYGYLPVEKILTQVQAAGATAIDIWPKVHGDQREQMEAIGLDEFEQLLKKHDVQLGCLTQYRLGPFGLKDEMAVAKRFGCKTIVTGAVGPKGLSGDELKKEVAKFAEAMKPHLELAEELGVVIAIENHGNNLIETPDSMKYLMDLASSEHLRIAFAPYHLPEDEELLSQLIRDLSGKIEVFYAWQHGKGCMEKQPKEDELLQMPGRGALNFEPLLEALVDSRFDGWFEIFMHPFPRGIPIMESLEEVTTEINRSRSYLEGLIS